MMEEDLAALKRTLLCVVVSSPTTMTVYDLVQDYRNLVGGNIPVSKFGYRDIITLIRERCLDIFVVEGLSWDPILTPIVTENLKHIDQLVQKQNVKSSFKYKGKRRSVSGPVNRSHTPNTPKDSNDSGAHSSDSSSSKLKEMKNEIVELIRASAEGVWFTDLMWLYKEAYGRELNISRFGHTSLWYIVTTLRDRIAMTRPDPLGDYLLQDPASVVAEGRERAVTQPLRRSEPNHSRRDPATNPDDALLKKPGVESDADVYPEDCMQYLDTIPSADISALAAGSQLEVLIREVYSPSHFWLQQVGPEHNLAMETLMDRMNEHYMTDARQLAPGALRVGQYCAVLYEKDWHRSIIVKIINSDTVKVRHVDSGTVDTVTTSDLRYLPREFGQLREQAVRALLAACRPSALGQRWPHAATTDFLRAVRDKRLYANIVAVERKENILETFLTDTSGETNVCMTRTLVRLGHADPRYDSALAVSVGSPPASAVSVDVRSIAASVRRSAWLLALSDYSDGTSTALKCRVAHLVCPPLSLLLYDNVCVNTLVPYSSDETPPEVGSVLSRRVAHLRRKSSFVVSNGSVSVSRAASNSSDETPSKAGSALSRRVALLRRKPSLML